MQDRGERRFQTKRITKQRVRQWHAVSQTELSEAWQQSGRFNKQSPFDCGHPACSLCHPHKSNPTGKYHLRRADRINRIVDRERNTREEDLD